MFMSYEAAQLLLDAGAKVTEADFIRSADKDKKILELYVQKGVGSNPTTNAQALLYLLKSETLKPFPLRKRKHCLFSKPGGGLDILHRFTGV